MNKFKLAIVEYNLINYFDRAWIHLDSSSSHFSHYTVINIASLIFLQKKQIMHTTAEELLVPQFIRGILGIKNFGNNLSELK